MRRSAEKSKTVQDRSCIARLSELTDKVNKHTDHTADKNIKNGGKVLAVYGCNDKYTLRIEGNKNTFANNITDFILKDKDVKMIFSEAIYNAFIKDNDLQIHNQRSVKN